MSNNLITLNDFEKICRTCLSKADLKPLHEKWLLEKLALCTSVKVSEFCLKTLNIQLSMYSINTF